MAAHRHVVNEEVFRAVLSGERKRAARSDQGLLLLLVSLEAGRDRGAPGVWETIVEALTTITGETDICGWFTSGAVLGVIVADVPGDAIADRRAALAAAVRSELGRRLDAASAARVRFGVQLESGPGGAAGAPGRTDPLADGDVARRGRVRIGYDAVKRALDIAISLALLVILSPLLLAVALAVKWRSRGPVLFGQPRIGQMMKPFTMLKFRTMHVGADAAIHREFVRAFINGSGAAAAGPGPTFKLVNDPRVTPMGRVLRKTSLDELPQLWNVLRGDMSLVGPRPPLPYELEQYKAWHRRRLMEAKPGITGLWQVTGRSRTTFDDMVRLDLRYARARSLWTDVRILLATPAAVISGKGAY